MQSEGCIAYTAFKSYGVHSGCLIVIAIVAIQMMVVRVLVSAKLLVEKSVNMLSSSQCLDRRKGWKIMISMTHQKTSIMIHVEIDFPYAITNSIITVSCSHLSSYFFQVNGRRCCQVYWSVIQWSDQYSQMLQQLVIYILLSALQDLTTYVKSLHIRVQYWTWGKEFNIWNNLWPVCITLLCHVCVYHTCDSLLIIRLSTFML